MQGICRSRECRKQDTTQVMKHKRERSGDHRRETRLEVKERERDDIRQNFKPE